MKCRNNKHQNKQIMVIPLRHSGPTLEKWWTLGVIQDVVSNRSYTSSPIRQEANRPILPQLVKETREEALAHLVVDN